MLHGRGRGGHRSGEQGRQARAVSGAVHAQVLVLDRFLLQVRSRF